MNLYNVINEIEKVDPEVYDRLDGRRDALERFTGFAGKVAAVSLPLMMGSMFRKAYGQTTTDIIGVLNFALTLEFLESEFYKKGVAAPGLIPAADLAGITTIRDHENAHVTALKQTITALGGTPVSYTATNFDYSGGNSSAMNGPYANVFTNYDTFLAVSQAFEDTGVRAYKGQAANLISNNEVLTAALQIHSVENPSCRTHTLHPQAKRCQCKTMDHREMTQEVYPVLLPFMQEKKIPRRPALGSPVSTV